MKIDSEKKFQDFSSILWYWSTSPNTARRGKNIRCLSQNPFNINGFSVLIGAYFHDFEVDRYDKIDENSWNFFSEFIFILRLQENYREPPKTLKSPPSWRRTFFVTQNSRDRVLTCLWEREYLPCKLQQLTRTLKTKIVILSLWRILISSVSLAPQVGPYHLRKYSQQKNP